MDRAESGVTVNVAEGVTVKVIVGVMDGRGVWVGSGVRVGAAVAAGALLVFTACAGVGFGAGVVQAASRSTRVRTFVNRRKRRMMNLQK